MMYPAANLLSDWFGKLAGFEILGGRITQFSLPGTGNEEPHKEDRNAS
jgi:hypothetical protein